MAVQEQLPIKELCRLCKKSCTEPKFLPCKHAFCKACLRFKIITVPANLQWEGFSCPFCKKYTKAIDPDQPLTAWADQFPDRWQPKKKFTPREFPTKPQIATKPQTPFMDKPSEATRSPEPSLVSGASGSTSRIGSEQNESPITISRDSSVDEGSSTSIYGSVTSEPMSPTPTSETSPPASPLNPELATPSPSSTLGTSLPDSQTVPEPAIPSPISNSPLSDMTDGPEATQPFEAMTSVHSKGQSDIQGTLDMFTKGTDSEEEMCMIHPWKPILLSCKKCVSVACGQCLTESHKTCRAEDFDPLSEVCTLPDVSKLVDETHRVSSFSDIWTSSAGNLEQTRVELRKRISQIAGKMIQDIEKEKVQMVQRVQQLYRDEIWRLKSGINPSESLLKEVKQVKHDTESLSSHHPTQIVLRADSILEKQQALLEHLGTVDFACVPPEINFVENNMFHVSLGDLIVDPGFYPKHDVGAVQLEVELSSLAIAGDGDSTDSASRDGSDPGVASGLGQTSRPKKKKHSLANLFSPARKPEKNSKFYVDAQ
ncbi:uncharacterized protein LOC124149417 [Haliotis rufescens]|uniref:uncharacterized protein LOC124149417 n=1 Tax=Haliotis rufescens TaxID=6454 RepID=UPI001EAFC8C3|nr:uncharacterized protein LOC124149417 [Haliotis rufescens]XP_046376950.1 uncharacterized protein LOC124149417 [Haliotis rufescens]